MIARLLRARSFDIEVTNHCNIDCVFCPRKKIPVFGFMSEHTFNCFLNNTPLRRYDCVSFIGLGEPLLNKNLPRFIKLTKERYPDTHVTVFTNGTLLTAEMTNSLIDAGLDFLVVSFNGVDSAEYESKMKGANFNVTVENIKRAAELCAKSRIYFAVDYIATKENIDRKSEIEAFWRAMGVSNLWGLSMTSRCGLVNVSDMTPIQKPGLHGHSCEKFEFMPFLSWQGDVYLCSYDILREHKFGNICQDTYKTIEKRRKRIIRNHEWPLQCNSCEDDMRFAMGRNLFGSLRLRDFSIREIVTGLIRMV